MPCAQGETKPGTAAQSDAEGTTLGVLGPWLGCVSPKRAGAALGGSQRGRGRPKEEGVHPTVAAGLCYPRAEGKEASGIGCPCLQQHSVPMEPGTDGLGVTTLCCCWEGRKHWFGSTVVVRREKKPLSKALEGFPWKSVQVLDWALPQLLCGMAPGSHGSTGQQCHPALPESPFCCFPVVLRTHQLTRGRESLGDHPSPASSPWWVPQGTSCTGAGMDHELDLPRLCSSPSAWLTREEGAALPKSSCEH